MKLSLCTVGMVALSFAAAGCVMLPPPQGAGAGDPNAASAAGAGAGDPSTAAPAGGPSGPSTGTPTAAAAATPAAPKPMIPTSLEVHSDCTKTVGVFLGEKPGFSSGTRSSVSSNSTTTYPRKPDGSLVFWLLDEKDNGVTSVTVSATTKRVTIDRSCKSLSAS